MVRQVKITLGNMKDATYSQTAADIALQSAPVTQCTVDDQDLGSIFLDEALEIAIAKYIYSSTGKLGWPTSIGDFDYCCDLKKRRSFLSVRHNGIQYFGRIEW